MDLALLLTMLTSFLVTGGATTTKNGTVYTRVDIDDHVITERLRFEAAAKNTAHCALKCNQYENCLTFTFDTSYKCRGHSTHVTLSTALTPASGAVSFSRGNNALKCQQTGVKKLTVPSVGLEVEVYCDDDWLVFMKRQDGSVDFYRDWNDYASGFGSASGEYWLGLENIHQITQLQAYELRVDMEDWDGGTAFATYSNFSLSPAADGYRLQLLAFLGGTAGDSLTSNHRGRPFSTKDADNDLSSWQNCAERHHGAWWYNNCKDSNLCGKYTDGGYAPNRDGMLWVSHRGNDYSVKTAEMKIRPAS